MIHEVIADINTDAAERSGTSADVIAAVRQLVLIANDDLIAGISPSTTRLTMESNRGLTLNNAARLLLLAGSRSRDRPAKGEVPRSRQLPPQS